MKELKILIFVIVMGSLSSLFLLGINSSTQDKIARNEEFRIKSAVLDALEIAHDKTSVIDIFNSQVKVIEKDKYIFYFSADGSFAFEFAGPGLWGPISGIISLENNAKTIRQIKITHIEETPGLGGRLAEKEYLAQFRKKQILPRLSFVPEGKASANNEVDAITGATGSSRAFEKLINQALSDRLKFIN